MALVCKGAGKYALSLEAPLPKIEPHMVLVQVVAVSINPSDWKMAERAPTPGAVGGFDFAGIVVQCGQRPLRAFTPGDRVYGIVFGLNPLCSDVGAFSQYTGADSALLGHIPASMSFEEAATMSMGLMTCGMALYHRLALPPPMAPAEKPIFVLVYGGSTATGTLAIQLLRL